MEEEQRITAEEKIRHILKVYALGQPLFPREFFKTSVVRSIRGVMKCTLQIWMALLRSTASRSLPGVQIGRKIVSSS